MARAIRLVMRTGMPVLPSVCPLDCPDRCSLAVTVEGGKVEGIAGTRKNPLTDGYICAKVSGFGQRVHGPDRLLHPGVRVGPKGDGATFARVSWDEAIARVAETFSRIIAESGPEAILPYWYGGSNGLVTGGGVDQRLWNRLGTTRIARTLCAANTGAAIRSVYGDLPAADPADVSRANLIVLWGVNPSVTGIHLVPLVRDAVRRGARLVVVDPRKTPLARQAHLHLPVLPGTDVVVALAVANLAFARGTYDRRFLEEVCPDWNEYRETASQWPAERAAAVAGIDAGSIVALAELYAESNPALLRIGWGPERNRNGTDAIRAISSLPAVFGKFGVRGGGFCLSTSAGYRADPARWQTVPGAPTRSPRLVNMTELGRILEETRDPPIRALYVYNCNPAATVPDQARVLRALSRPDLFVVVHEQVHTDTVPFADVVLPATTFLEHEELTRSYGGYLLQWSEPVIPPVGEARSNHEVFTALARALGFGDEAAFRGTPADLARDVVAGTASAPASAWEGLQRDRVVLLPSPVQFGDIRPSSGVVHLCGALGPPRYRPPPTLVESPLVLVSPASRRAITSTLFERHGEGRVQLHPDDARPRGIVDGMPVRVFNALGEVVVRAEVTDEVRPGVAAMPKGLWRRATRNGLTATALAPAHVDEIGGGACYNDARVDIAPFANG